MDPLERGSTVVGVIGYREKTKSGKPRYCLYSQDGEDLIIAAEEQATKHFRYVISESSTAFETDSPRFIGTVTPVDQKFCQVSALDPEQREALIDVLKVGIGRKRRDIPEYTILPVFQNVGDTRFFIAKADYGGIVQASREEIEDVMQQVGALPSPRNQAMKYICDDCFMLAAVHDDEYKFMVGHPLSVFQGFCIVMAIMKNIEHTPQST